MDVNEKIKKILDERGWTPYLSCKHYLWGTDEVFSVAIISHLCYNSSGITTQSFFETEAQERDNE